MWTTFIHWNSYLYASVDFFPPEDLWHTHTPQIPSKFYTLLWYTRFVVGYDIVEVTRSIKIEWNITISYRRSHRVLFLELVGIIEQDLHNVSVPTRLIIGIAIVCTTIALKYDMWDQTWKIISATFSIYLCQKFSEHWRTFEPTKSFNVLPILMERKPVHAYVSLLF